MAKYFSDGFDAYSTAADMTAGHWDGTGGGLATPSFVAGRFTGSQAVNFGTASGGVVCMTKTLSGNLTIFWINFAIRLGAVITPGASAAFCLVLMDGANSQVTLDVRQDGNLYIRGGGASASIIATYSNWLSQSVWTHIQCKITINNTTGRIQIRKNGNTSDDFDSGSINTRNGSTNAYINKILWQSGAVGGMSSSSSVLIDDWYMFDDQGAAPNTWVGDIKCKPAYASADTAQKNFVGSAVPRTISNATFSTASAAAGAAKYNRFTPTFNGTLTGATIYANANTTANVKLVIFDATGAGGAPGAPLSSTEIIVNPVIGANTVTFATPVSVVSGTTYYLGVDQDAAVVWQLANLNTASTATVAYASFPTTNPAGTVSAQLPHGMIIYITAPNYSFINEVLEDGDTTYVFSATVSDRDLYNITYTDIPGTIIDVTQRAFMKKSSSGTRNGQLVQKAGGGSHTVTLGADTVESSSYTWHKLDGPLNPDTGLAWTPSEVSALQIGQQVSA